MRVTVMSTGDEAMHCPRDPVVPNLRYGAGFRHRYVGLEGPSTFSGSPCPPERYIQQILLMYCYYILKETGAKTCYKIVFLIFENH